MTQHIYKTKSLLWKFSNKKLKIFDFFQNVKNLLEIFAAETLQIKQSR